jgi:predicted RNA binding protein YcfA (HicA-like mRNA interferase family)
VKLPRDLSGSAVVKGLERRGFAVARQSGSHVRLVKADKRVTVPTLQSILRQAGITIEDLLNSL